MRVSVVVYDEDALDCAAHAKIFIVVLEALEACGDGGILLWLGFLCAAWVRAGSRARGVDLPKGEVGERVEGDGIGHGGTGHASHVRNGIARRS